MPLLFLTACSAPKPPALVLQSQPPPPATDDTIRYPEVARAYHVGRYVDPSDDLLMHERHVVYRVEDNARWDLHPATTHHGLAGGSLLSPSPAHDAAYNLTPVNDDIVAQVNAQRLATVQIELEAKTLAAALARFQAALQQTKTNLQEMALLRVQVSVMQQQLNAVKPAQAQEAVPAVSFSTNQPPDGFFDTNSDQFSP